MASPTATSADTFFEEKGIVLPYHLTTRRKRWASLLVVCVCSAFASGPFASWPTLEPILTSEGVFAGPDQTLKLTLVMTIGVSSSAISQLFAGILYDAMGPRLLAGGSCCLICIGLLVMALAVHFQSLNPLLYVAYPIVLALSCMNNMGGYAWLYLLPGESSSVASITGSIRILCDSFVLVAVFLYSEFKIGTPVYFMICACFALFAGLVCFWFIPSRQFNKQVAAAVQSTVSQCSEDVENHSYGAIQGSIPDRDDADDSIGQILKRSGRLWRDCCKCMVGLYPYAFFVYLFCYGVTSFMFALFPQMVMFPFDQALLGKNAATVLVDLWGGIYPCTAACFLIFLGRAVDYFGFRVCFAGLLVSLLVNLALFSVPHFTSQVFAQVCLACQANGWYVMLPVFVLAYAPPELYGTVFGVYGFASGILQVPLTPLGVFVSGWLDNLVTRGHASTSMVLLTTFSLWCYLAVAFGVALLIYWRYYPMPPIGATTMTDVHRAWRRNTRNGLKKGFATSNKEDAETHYSQAASTSSQAVSRSRIPTCLAPCLSGTWICAQKSGS